MIKSSGFTQNSSLRFWKVIVIGFILLLQLNINKDERTKTSG